MKHKASQIIVYETDDYGRFQLIKGNRKTNEIKQKRIMNEIEHGNDILDEDPILVTVNGEKLEIKDGQNRFQICKKLGRPVHYIIKKQAMSLYNLAKINSNQEKWTSQNFIDCYAAAGNENYVQLGKFHKKYGFAIGSCLILLTYGLQKNDGGADELKIAFESGSFEVKKWKDAVHFAEICKQFSEFPAWTGRGFIVAMTRILQSNVCEMDRLVAKFNKNPGALTVQPNWKGYISKLQEIYNKDNSTIRPIV